MQTRFIPLTIDIGDVTEVKIDFKKTGNLISSSWYSSSWTFTKATVLNGDQQDRYDLRPHSTRPLTVRFQF